MPVNFGITFVNQQTLLGVLIGILDWNACWLDTWNVGLYINNACRVPFGSKENLVIITK